MRRLIGRTAICFLIVSVFACAAADTGNALTRMYFASLEAMIAKSDSIVEVAKTRAVVVEERYIPGELFEVEVLRVIKGDSAKLHRKIKVLDLNGVNDKEEHFVLMLQPEIVEYGEDVYGTIGIAEGILVVDEQGKLRYGGWSEPENGDEHLLAKAFDGLPLDKAIAKFLSPDLRVSADKPIPAEVAALALFGSVTMMLIIRYRSDSALTSKRKK